MPELGQRFGFEIVTEGSFVSEDYTVSTIVVRLNGIALNEYICSDLLNSRETYGTDKEYEEYKQKKNAERKQWERKILDGLKFTQDTGYSITRSVSEIFTAVLFEKREG